jgi:hypothetical protein
MSNRTEIIRWLRLHPHDAMLLVPMIATILVCGAFWILEHLLHG